MKICLLKPTAFSHVLTEAIYTVVTDETAMTSKVTGLYYFRFGERPEEIPQLSLIADEISMIMSLSDSWYYVKYDVLYAIPSSVEESIKIADNVKRENKNWSIT